MDDQWRKRAVCAGDEYTVDDFSTPGPHPSMKAKKACASCPVREECLAETVAWEIENVESRAGMFGYTGGMTVTERWVHHVGPALGYDAEMLKRDLEGLLPVPSRTKGPRRARVARGEQRVQMECKYGHVYTDDDWKVLSTGKRVRKCSACSSS